MHGASWTLWRIRYSIQPIRSWRPSSFHDDEDDKYHEVNDDADDADDAEEGDDDDDDELLILIFEQEKREEEDGASEGCGQSSVRQTAQFCFGSTGSWIFYQFLTVAYCSSYRRIQMFAGGFSLLNLLLTLIL